MKITILTYGSRGDFQPFLALAVGLQQAGHTVRIAAPGRFADFSAQYQIQFAPLAGDPADLSKTFNEAGSNVYRMVRSMQEHVFAIAPQVAQQAWLACTDAQLIVHSFLFTTAGHTFACEMGIPDVSVQTFPMFAPTCAYPNVAFANVPPGWLSYFTHWLATKVFWYGGNSGYFRLRKKFPGNFPKKLYWPFTSKSDRPPSPLLFAYSPTVLPKPEDWSSASIYVPGYFFLNENGYKPPAELSDYIAKGESPVCVSFGSMVSREAECIGRAVLDALVRTSQRAVILTGWSGWKPAEIPKYVLYLDSASHHWLFPRCNVIVHHGGAGTTGAALRAGVPNVIVPFAADQPFWGKRVAAIGAGPDPIPVRRFDADSFASAIHYALNDSLLRQRAAKIGAQIRSENGVATAVQLIEAWASDFLCRVG